MNMGKKGLMRENDQGFVERRVFFLFENAKI